MELIKISLKYKITKLQTKSKLTNFCVGQIGNKFFLAGLDENMVSVGLIHENFIIVTPQFKWTYYLLCTARGVVCCCLMRLDRLHLVFTFYLIYHSNWKRLTPPPSTPWPQHISVCVKYKTVYKQIGLGKNTTVPTWWRKQHAADDKQCSYLVMHFGMTMCHWNLSGE